MSGLLCVSSVSMATWCVMRVDGGGTETLAALRRLAPRDQEVLRLVAWEGLKGGDLATALGTSEAAARSRLYRARHRYERALRAERALTNRGEQHG